jgi:AraC-like DNA-binding protein/quercetin dioxygenase-like cupin family protein
MGTETELPWEMDFPVLEPQINARGVHVWPFEPSFPVEVRFFECGEHHSVRMNRHDYFELVYVYSGEATFQIQDRFFPVKGGDLVMIGSTLYHRQLAKPDGTKDRIVILIFQPELIRTATANGDGVEYLLPFYSQDSEFPHVVPAQTGIPARILELIREIRTELPATSNRGRLAVKTYLKMILVLLVNHYTDYLGSQKAFNHKQIAIDRLRPLFEWVDRHSGEPITVSDAAKISAMSTSYFMRFFKQVTGQSFLSYLNNFRIAKSQILLSTTDKSISEISQEIGFCDQSYFGMVFRKLVQTTPMSYRRRFGKPSEGILYREETAQ